MKHQCQVGVRPSVPHISAAADRQVAAPLQGSATCTRRAPERAQEALGSPNFWGHFPPAVAARTAPGKSLGYCKEVGSEKEIKFKHLLQEAQ